MSHPFLWPPLLRKACESAPLQWQPFNDSGRIQMSEFCAPFYDKAESYPVDNIHLKVLISNLRVTTADFFKTTNIP